MFLRCGRFSLPLARPLVMGVLNVTPDSFYDGGKFADRDAAVVHARRMAAEGADIVDVGAESTRPGAGAISEEEELRRLIPVIEAVVDLPVPVSVDTRRVRVMRAVLAAGASMINDVQALQSPGALETVAASDCAVCLMHMRGDPATMQRDPQYADVVAEVRDFLARRVADCERAGIRRDRIAIDPGFGFGKTLAHNLELLRRLTELAPQGIPLLVGLSRKSMLGAITGEPARDRLAPSIAAALLAAQHGAKILRVHDVRETRDALSVWEALRKP